MISLGSAKPTRSNRELGTNFHFAHICVESMGPWGDYVKKLTNRRGELLKEATSFLNLSTENYLKLI